MRFISNFLAGAALAIAMQFSPLSAAEAAVPILVYHRFGPMRSDTMTVTTAHFKEQMDLLCKNHFSVIPLASFVGWRLGRGSAPPPRSVVVTFDDGHVSVYREARSIVIKSQIPVTLFIYLSCISHASYAMTWEQVLELAATPYFTVQSHTFWHPNFKQDSKKLDRVAYAASVDMQLRRSKAVLEEKFKRPVHFLAWPFGIYDPYLVDRASAAGYQAGFTIECRAATRSDPLLTLPRCLVSDNDVGPRFLELLDSAIRRARD
ncbi:MAG TPA: polysaccharide deacetylase family protein [Bryobacteraceae bacterium]